MTEKQSEVVIGVDLGATKIKSARVSADRVEETYTTTVSAEGAQEVIVQEVIEAIGAVYQDDVSGIGVGVPSVVDIEAGIVYDVQNIPSWVEVPLKDILQKHFAVPVHVNNDANCFALGEFYYGQGRGVKDLVGLIIGTGMAAGLVLDGKLYAGSNCGAGEVGMIPYLDHHYEYYCSGQFFETAWHVSGEDLYQRATAGDEEALKIFETYGHHLAHGIMTVLFAYDPELIVLGGSVSKAYRFFEAGLNEVIRTFPYTSVLRNLRIEVSREKDIAVKGAAALRYNAHLTVKDKFVIE